MSINMDKLLAARRALEEKKAQSGDFQSVKFLKLNAGANLLRICPPWTNEGQFAGDFYREVAQHWNYDEEQKAPLLCPNKTPDIKEACPICEFIDELRADKTNVEAQQLAKDLRAKTTWFLNVVNVKDPVYTAADVAEAKQAKPDAEPSFKAGDLKVQVFAPGPTIFNGILNVIIENKLDITNPETGHNITITKSGKGLNTDYSVTPQIAPSKLEGFDHNTKLNDLGVVGFRQDYTELLAKLTAGKGGEFKGTTKAMTAPKGAKAALKAPVEEEDDLPESWNGIEQAEDEDMAAALEREMLAASKG